MIKLKQFGNLSVILTITKKKSLLEDVAKFAIAIQKAGILVGML